MKISRFYCIETHLVHWTPKLAADPTNSATIVTKNKKNTKACNTYVVSVQIHNY